MRDSGYGHFVDIGKGVIASLIATCLWWLGARYSRSLPPSLTLSAWWLGGPVFLGCAVALVSWMRTRPYEKTYAAWQSPMLQTRGEIITDAGSRAERVWHAGGNPNDAGAILYGPYRTLKPGTYLAVFRVKLRLRSPKGHYWIEIARCHGDSESEALAGRANPHSEDTNGQYQPRVERFTVTREMARDLFEFRVRIGNPDIDVWVDTITIQRLG